MNQENELKNSYSWDLLDTMTLMLPEEIIAYHIYRHEAAIKNKRPNEASKEAQILTNYIQKEKKKKAEVGTCFQK